MDMFGFAAFGGMERVAIIAGALLIGYWGYRLYAGGKPAGLAFLGIACAMLFGALLTGGSHVRSVGEGIQLASAVKTPPAPADVEAVAVPEVAPEAPATPPALPAEPVVATEPPSTEPTRHEVDAKDGEANTAIAQAREADDAVAETSGTSAADADTADAIRRLATAQELGGRIVAVKSDNVSLEWSAPEPER